MRRSLLAFVISAAACGGSQKPTTPPPPLPDDKPPVTETKPTEPQEKPAAPARSKGPVEVTLPAPKVEVKLVNAGKGKKAKLALSPKAGTKQSTELVLDFTGGQDGPPETGGKRDEIAPTVVLVADAETQAVDGNGQAKFVMTISGVDVKDRAGQKVSSAEFKTELESLVGATISGTVDADGKASDIKVRIEQADWICATAEAAERRAKGDLGANPGQCQSKAEGALEFVRLGLLPMFPVLPGDAIGAGAKWTVTSKQKLADQVEVTKVVSYELVGKKGAASTIKGTTKVTGDEQEVEAVPGQPKAKLGNIGGDGTAEIVVNDGGLVPAAKQKIATGFSITLSAPATPAGEHGPAQPARSIEMKFRIEQQNAVTPKS